MPKIVVVIPVFNEEKTLLNVLGRVGKQADLMICVNDGSKDDSLRILKKFQKKKKGLFVVELPVNTGMAGAIENGLLFAVFLKGKKLISDEDVIVTIDADGQHKPEYIRPLVKFLVRGGYDVVLTRRDFSAYPLYKVWGNRFLTWTNSILSGFRYKDVESGLRALKLKTIEPILGFYTGLKYSCAQEIALISAREDFKINNDFVVDIAYYRPGTTVWDGFIVLFLSLLTYLRWCFRLRQKVTLNQAVFEIAFKSTKNDRTRSVKVKKR
jgi:glycosyltransferase involved in cell wall biosynthesis